MWGKQIEKSKGGKFPGERGRERGQKEGTARKCLEGEEDAEKF